MADNYALLQKASELSWNAYCHWIACQQLMFLVASKLEHEMSIAAFDWQSKEATDSVDTPITFPLLHLQNADGKLSLLCEGTSYVKNSKRCKVKDLNGPFPRACLMHRMIGEILDDSQQQRDQYTKLAQRLWIGDYGTGMFSNANKQFNDSKMILERLLVAALSTRQKYHRQLWICFGDVDLERSLDAKEADMLRDAWEDDVETWMPSNSYKEYMRMVREANKTSKKKKNADDNKKERMHHQVQLFKKHEFEHTFERLSTSEAFFMVFVRHPLLPCPDRMLIILDALSKVHAPMYLNSAGYSIDSNDQIKRSELKSP